MREARKAKMTRAGGSTWSSYTNGRCTQGSRIKVRKLSAATRNYQSKHASEAGGAFSPDRGVPAVDITRQSFVWRASVAQCLLLTRCCRRAAAGRKGGEAKAAGRTAETAMKGTMAKFPPAGADWSKPANSGAQYHDPCPVVEPIDLRV